MRIISSIPLSSNDALEKTAPDFDRLAHIYRWMEWFSFGPLLQRCRISSLNEMKDCRSALLLGDGDGRFAERLLVENPKVRIDAVDSSSAMLGELRERAAPNSDRVRTHVSDIRIFEPQRRDYDLFVTHFFLDCLKTEEVHALARRLRSHSDPDAIWVVSEFAVPPGWFGKVVAQPLISSLYRAFAWLTGLKVRRLPEHRLALARAGWSLKREHTQLGGLLVSELWRSVQFDPN